MKIRKVRRGKRFQYNRNRKRVFKSRQSTGKIKIKDLEQYWNEKKPVNINIKDMGLATDSNKSVGIPNYRQERLKLVKSITCSEEEEEEEIDGQVKNARKPRKAFVAQKLEEEAKVPRISQFKLPKGHIKELTYFLDKYKLDYDAMVCDRKNYYQYTAKQFRLKIRKFMSIPEQFNQYLATKNLKPEEFDWKEIACLDN